MHTYLRTYIHTLHTLHYIHHITSHYITVHGITLVTLLTLHTLDTQLHAYHTIPYHTISFLHITLHYITLQYITIHYITLHTLHTYITYIHTYCLMSQLADDANLELSQKRQKLSTTRDRSKPKVTNIFFVSCWIFQSTLISFNAFLSR